MKQYDGRCSILVTARSCLWAANKVPLLECIDTHTHCCTHIDIYLPLPLLQYWHLFRSASISFPVGHSQRHSAKEYENPSLKKEVGKLVNSDDKKG